MKKGAPLARPTPEWAGQAQPNIVKLPARISTVASALLRTARPRQWIKNTLVVAAPGAAGVLTHGHDLLLVLVTFLLFCCVSSGTYFLNDSIDAEADRLHMTKCQRPIAAGTIPVAAGFLVAVFLLGLGVGVSAFITWRLSLILGIYVAIQIAYSLFLKHLPVYDLACVAAGFVVRGIAGAVGVHVPVSEWFLIVATFGSLLMVTGKRAGEQVELGSGAGAHRTTLGLYTPVFLRTVVTISAGGAIVGYCLWAFALQTALKHHSDPIWYQLSIVPMVIALLRYTFLVEGGDGSRPEDLVLGDYSLIGLGVVWGVLFGLGVYAS